MSRRILAISIEISSFLRHPEHSGQPVRVSLLPYSQQQHLSLSVI